EQFFVLPGLEDKIGCALLDGADGKFHVPVGRNKDDNGIGVVFADNVEPVEPLVAAAAPVGEVHIEQDHVVGVLREQRGKACRIALCSDDTVMLLQQQPGRQQNVLVVVDDQNGSRRICHCLLCLQKM